MQRNFYPDHCAAQKKKPRPIVLLHVSSDIVLDILTRLPKKSLVRFRCVCNSWNSFITSPCFVATHLKKSQGFLLRMRWVSGKQLCRVMMNDRTYKKILEFEIPFRFPSGSARIVGSCNGILCLVDTARFGYCANFVYLWNPSIRKFKMLPSTCLSKLDTVVWGFAHQLENDDYKIVRMSYPGGLRGKIVPSAIEAEVYTTRSDSWRRVSGFPLRPEVILRVVRANELHTPFVCAALHWMLDSAELHCWRVVR